ncbi:Signal transduction histidine kinase [Cupriavidus gilardii CR3]|uniref:histidine kinase n=1 Tax=Cupriavidus gilardii TaxID=82541 RepID=A0A849BCD7_9BURK|nr:HAMP domain-containing sensor histidine kinase [Cupriavidus gilardii]ALD93687.1 Signal transduction histidine kinase [Cupriavidus gilardii CR3]KAB0597013.1 HAMP domain-containing histidine kinase [Cupriavidus gilardii]MCT9015008.1 HAMP domain-containing histidine kinase [Cupriavidus gilardii]MCT9053420.1 HAMP domain-containing histidine kinase [Cupriavidus gilardii]NNH10257.1 HAMP domain-containing histidine kinase [Cupriavidus gilardii]
MYAILPAFVSSIFLGYGLYVLVTRGVTRLTTTFFLMCATTFAWQGTWAFLFQTTHPDVALLLAKVGYLFIVFLPTTFYHFITEVTERRGERPWLLVSYGMSLLLAVVLLTSDRLVSDYYLYGFGNYPRAGILHPVHVAQTVLLALRSGWLLLDARRGAVGEKRQRLTLCLWSLGLYSLAAIDYAVNYGHDFYPPGVVFIAVSLGIIALSIVRYDLMHPYSLAATVAHEVRTPLATIRMQTQELAAVWPTVLDGYRCAVEHGLIEDGLRPGQLERLPTLLRAIRGEVDGTQAVIEMALASITLERLDRGSFVPHGVAQCVQSALERYPFRAGERERVSVRAIPDGWRFRGSDTLLVYVLFNLLKNALQAMRAHQADAADGGRIEISARESGGFYQLRVSDTGPGIPADVLPRIFDPFFSTKPHGSGAGMGLAFCRRVMEAFGGRIDCQSAPGRHTVFTLHLPVAVAAEPPEPAHAAAAIGPLDALERIEPMQPMQSIQPLGHGTAA